MGWKKEEGGEREGGERKRGGEDPRGGVAEGEERGGIGGGEFRLRAVWLRMILGGGVYEKDFLDIISNEMGMKEICFACGNDKDNSWFGAGDERGVYSLTLPILMF